MINKITRFPPEPNGFLHIGHCKSIFINFEQPNECHLRLDDTNPKNETREFADNIISDINWLGFSTNNVTYTSNYFDYIFNCAISLIKNNYAYVDFSDEQTVSDERFNMMESKYRNTTPEQNLENFYKMKDGEYNKCTLRLKINMTDPNPVLRDPIIYRTITCSHYRTKNIWKIYPTYDFSHCIVDCVENITHSYCTIEFFNRRELYYWIIDTLNKTNEYNLKAPKVTEYGKLTIENNKISKRYINDLINDNIISDYDDPRLFTIKGLRKRGFTPNIIKEIVSVSGMNKNDTVISSHYIDHVLRNYLNETSIRAFAVINPLLVHIEDIENFEKNTIHQNHPKKDIGSHITKINNEIYIESTDFRKVHDKKYYGFTSENIVRLKYSIFTKLVKYENNKITIKSAVPENPKKIKGCISWVSKDDSTMVKFELYENLFNSNEINRNSKCDHIGYVENFVMNNLDIIYQFERIGYFKFDRYENNIPVFIRIIKLKSEI